MPIYNTKYHADLTAKAIKWVDWLEDRFASLNTNISKKFLPPNNGWCTRYGLGDIACLRRGEIDLPGNGASTTLGIFREIVYEPDEDGQFKSSSGDTYIVLIEFSQLVRAQVLTTYDNATQNNMFEIGDQLHLAASQLHPAWRTLEKIKANLVLREKLMY
jgi:hypothetical protein